MTCKEYDKIIKDYDNAILALFMIRNSDLRITRPLKDLKINFDSAIFKLEEAKQNFVGKNTRGTK